MFRLSIVTPESVFFEADVTSLVVPGTDGYLGVLTGHAPLITSLKPGKVEYRDADDRPNSLAVSGGFLEVSNNVATLLADTAEQGQDIDIERARESHRRAWELLKSAESGTDLVSARRALDRAANRIRIFEEGGRS